MIRVDNQKILQRIAGQTYRANRKRNMATILAMILTTFLIVSVIGIGAAYWQMISERQIKMNGMDYDLELSEPTEEQSEIARNMDLIKAAGVCVKCAVLDTADDRKLSKLQLYWLDDICWEKQCIPALDQLTGDYPGQENEILLSAEALRDMGITEPEIGMDIHVTYTALTGEPTDVDSEEYVFQLCGYYTDFTGNSRGYVSEAFYHLTGAAQTDFTQGTLKISLKNALYSQKTVMGIQNALGLSNRQYLAADYDSISRFMKAAAVLASLLVMIFISGYLFIYNTLYISVTKDIKYYGQLKTIGMTSIQIKGIIYRQAVWNSLFGIPTGLLLGYLVSKKLIPLVMKMQNSNMAKTASFSHYPALFLISILFVSITIFVSSRKPARLAGSCSPIEAMRYTQSSQKYGNSENGVHHMAQRNMFRDRKRAMLVLGSFVVSMAIFFVVNVVIKENDSKSILNEIYDYDMRILNETIPENASEVITKEDIRKLGNSEGIEAVRPVYSMYIEVPYQEAVFGSFYKELYKSRYSPGNYQEDIQKYKNHQDEYGLFDSKIIGIDDAELKLLLESAAIEIDMDEFHDGKTALTSDFLTIRPEDALGKRVSFSPKGTEQLYHVEIAGIVTDPSFFASGYTPVIIVSEQWYKELISDPMIELAYIDYTASYDASAEKLVKSIFADLTEVSYDSKLDRYKDMLTGERQIRVLGNGIGLIIAFLAVLNYVNMMAAGVQNRRKEFATLESIGMTRRQIRTVLRKEGFCYAFVSTILALAVGIPASYAVFQSINIYGIDYKIPFAPDLLLILGVFLICVTVPPLIYRLSNTGTVLEELKAGDE